MLRDQFHVATSFLPTVGFPSRDTKIPGRDLPHCHPCRDLKNDVATSSFQLCRNLKILGCNTLKTNPGRDLKSMSRPQTVHPRSQRGFSCHDQGLLTRNLSQATTPKRMSRHQLLQSRSQCQNNVATSPCLAQVARALPRPWVRTSAVVGVGAPQPPLPCAPAVFLSRPQN